MNYDLPHEYSDVPSKDRLHKEKLSALVEGGVPIEFFRMIRTKFSKCMAKF